MGKEGATIVKAILLAAGRGSRLGERTREKPKCLCSLCGRTLLDRCLDSLYQAGIQQDHLAVVTGYRGEKIQIDKAVRFQNTEWEETNMFVSLTKAHTWLEQEPCIVCYSDIVFTPEPIRKLMDSQAALAIPYYTNYWELWSRRMADPLEDLETFRINESGELLEIGQRPMRRSDIQGQFMGLIRFTPESWANAMETVSHPIPKPVAKLDMTTLLNCMLQRGVKIQAIPEDSLWLECDTEDDIALYEREMTSLLQV